MAEGDNHERAAGPVGERLARMEGKLDFLVDLVKGWLEKAETTQSTLSDHNTRIVVLERAVHGTENTDGIAKDVDALKKAKQHGDGSRFFLWKIMTGMSSVAAITAAAAAVKTWFDSGHH